MKIVDKKPHESVVKQKICTNCGVTLEYVPKDVVFRKYSCCGSLECGTFIKCLNCEQWLEI
jgi:hypothetical protein